MTPPDPPSSPPPPGPGPADSPAAGPPPPPSPPDLAALERLVAAGEAALAAAHAMDRAPGGSPRWRRAQAVLLGEALAAWPEVRGLLAEFARLRDRNVELRQSLADVSRERDALDRLAAAAERAVADHLAAEGRKMPFGSNFGEGLLDLAGELARLRAERDSARREAEAGRALARAFLEVWDNPGLGGLIDRLGRVAGMVRGMAAGPPPAGEGPPR